MIKYIKNVKSRSYIISDLEQRLNKKKKNIAILNDKVLDNIFMKTYLTELLDQPIFDLYKDMRITETSKNNVNDIIINGYRITLSVDDFVSSDNVIILNILMNIDKLHNESLIKFGYDYIPHYRVFKHLINAICDSNSHMEILELFGILVYTISLANSSEADVLISMINKYKEDGKFGNVDISCKEIVNDKTGCIRRVLDYTINKLTTEKNSLKRIYDIELEELYETR